MLYQSFFPGNLFAELDRLQREFDGSLNSSPHIRGTTRRYPALNVGTTAQSVEVYAFAPGMASGEFDVQVENGALTISGERKTAVTPEGATVHVDECYAGRFRRVVTLPDDADPNSTTASYRDGVLHVSIARKQAAQPRRIAIQ